MRIVRFTPGPQSGLGADPLFGVLEEDNSITVISGDPIYHGITKTAAKVELSKVRLLAPVIPRSKIVAVGKNYADHAKEMGSDVPKEPIIFLKPNTSVIGPGDTIVWPAMAPTIDYEAELAVVIGITQLVQGQQATPRCRAVQPGHLGHLGDGESRAFGAETFDDAQTLGQ